ncbi:MAG TPA: hypothetical protein VGG24_05955 [Paraburkholderia sp.]
MPIKKREAFIQDFPKAAASVRPSEAGKTVGLSNLEDTLFDDVAMLAAADIARVRETGAAGSRQIVSNSCRSVRLDRYLFIIKAILKDSKVVVCLIVKAFARTSASSS